MIRHVFFIHSRRAQPLLLHPKRRSAEGVKVVVVVVAQLQLALLVLMTMNEPSWFKPNTITHVDTMSDSKSESSIASADAPPGATSEGGAAHRAALIDGKTVAAKIREELVARVKALVEAHGQVHVLVCVCGQRTSKVVHTGARTGGGAGGQP